MQEGDSSSVLEERPKNKRSMEADHTSGEEEVHAKKSNPGAPALLPMPAGSTGFFIDPKWLRAKIERDKLHAKSAPPVEEEIPTLKDFEPPTYFHTRELLHIRESGTKAVLIAAKSLLGISSSLGGKPLKRCSGFWIDWSGESKTGIILTTAHLIRTKNSPVNIWSGGEEYASHANVTVHLLDGTSAEGQLIYYQPHYDHAFVRVRVDTPVQLPSFNEEAKLAQDVFRLGRDNMLNLRITYDRVLYQNPTTYERYHNMYLECAGGANDYKEYDNGGPVIDLDGEVVGISNNSKGGTFMPSAILLNCVDLWKKYDTQIGDIIERCNGECISTTIELENMLTGICKGSKDNLNGVNVEVHVSVGVFHTLKKHRTVGELTANVSDLGDVIA